MPCSLVVSRRIGLFTPARVMPILTKSATQAAVTAELTAHGSGIGQGHRHAPSPGATATLIHDLRELFKVKVVGLVLVTGWGGFYLGSMQSGISSVQRGLLEDAAWHRPGFCRSRRAERGSGAQDRRAHEAHRRPSNGRGPILAGTGSAGRACGSGVGRVLAGRSPPIRLLWLWRC